MDQTESNRFKPIKLDQTNQSRSKWFKVIEQDQTGSDSINLGCGFGGLLSKSAVLADFFHLVETFRLEVSKILHHLFYLQQLGFGPAGGNSEGGVHHRAIARRTNRHPFGRRVRPT